jgi:P-type Ca2+ transporter type 2C
MEIDIKKRSYHVISGRLRTELYGLKNNPDVAHRFEQVFSAIEGVLQIETNIISGKILLQFDENMVSLEELCLYISKFEEKIFNQFYCFNKEVENDKDVGVKTFSEVAATYDYSTEKGRVEDSSQKIISSILSYLPKNQWARAPADEKVPLPLALSVTGLGILGIKQLFFGRSILARHPFPFYLAATSKVLEGKKN